MGIAGFIASGLGLVGTLTSSESTTASTGHGPASSLSYKNTTQSSLQSSHNGTGTSSSPISTAQSAIGNAFANLTYTGDCWNQWNQFWIANSSLTKITWEETTITTTAVKTLSFYDFITSDMLVTLTVTEYQGAYPQRTYTTVSTSESYPASSGPTATVTTLETLYPESRVSLYPNATITTPPCTLPSIVSQCQSSWDSWALQQLDVPGNPPACSQASVSGKYCSGLVSSYLSVAQVYAVPENGRVGDATTYFTLNDTESSSLYWPTNTQFAPGCTLGCPGCRVNGGTVQLLFWPPMTSNVTMNHTGPVTSVGFGTTFTSPTVYISFDSLYASDSCGPIGPTYSNTIIPITDTTHLSSLYSVQRYNKLGLPASFNFTDLYSLPVPDSIYNSQPRCATSYNALWPHYPANWTCPRTLPYLPILSLPAEVRNVNPDWAHCSGGVDGVYDPPLALHPANSAADATLPSWLTSTIATAVPSPVVKTTAAPMTPSVSVFLPLTTPSPNQTPSQSRSTDGPQSTQSSPGTVVAGSTTVIIGSQTITLPPPLDGTQAFQNAQSTWKVAAGDAPITIGSQRVSVNNGGIVIGTGTAATTLTRIATTSITIGTATFTAFGQEGGTVVLGGPQMTLTIRPGASAATLGGQAVSLGTDNALALESSTIQLAPFLSSIPNHVGHAVTLGSQVFTERSKSNGQYIFANAQTTFAISAGGTAAVIDGQSISASGGNVFALGTTLVTVAPLVEVLSVGAMPYTVSSDQANGDVVVVGPSTTATLLPGKAGLTLSSLVISEKPDGAVTVESANSRASEPSASTSTSTSKTSGATRSLVPTTAMCFLSLVLWTVLLTS